jgi:ferredoxin-NADP reductase
MPRAQQFKAKLVNKQILNEKFIHFRFELKEPDTIDFDAGQYIMFTVDDQRTKRSYSISNAPDDNNHVEVFLDVTPNGVGVNFLRDLKVRDEVEFLGPIGRFTVDVEQKGEEVVLIGTGCGLAPLRSMLLDRLKDEQDKRPIKLYWGLRYPKQVAFQRELQTLNKAHDNFEYYLVLSRSEQGEPNCKHVTDCLTKDTVNPKAGFYMCGNDHMIKDVTEILTNLGVPQENIHHEKFDLSC